MGYVIRCAHAAERGLRQSLLFSFLIEPTRIFRPQDGAGPNAIHPYLWRQFASQ